MKKKTHSRRKGFVALHVYTKGYVPCMVNHVAVIRMYFRNNDKEAVEKVFDKFKKLYNEDYYVIGEIDVNNMDLTY